MRMNLISLIKTLSFKYTTIFASKNTSQTIEAQTLNVYPRTKHIEYTVRVKNYYLLAFILVYYQY